MNDKCENHIMSNTILVWVITMTTCQVIWVWFSCFEYYLGSSNKPRDGITFPNLVSNLKIIIINEPFDNYMVGYQSWKTKKQVKYSQENLILSELNFAL